MSVQAVHTGLVREIVGDVVAGRAESPAAIAHRASRQNTFITWMIYLTVTVAFINLAVMFLVDDRSPTALFALSSVLHVFAAAALVYHQRHFLKPILRASERCEHDDTMWRVEREMHQK